MKKILSISIISTLLFISNLSFAQNSDDTILVQLNNLQIKEIQQNPEEGILAIFIVTKSSLGFKCQYFPDEESKPKPCPLKLRRNILKALRQGLKVNISEETELLDINRENITIQDFQVGDKINVYGELDKQSYEIDALIVRRIGKGKIVPPPVTGVIKVIVPNGGEVWQKGTTQFITWQDDRLKEDRRPIRRIYYDIYLIPKEPGCVGNICPIKPETLPAPYIIEEKVTYQTGQALYYEWDVGVAKVVTDGNYGPIKVPDGEYKIKICESGTNNCDMSDNYFKIVSAPVTGNIKILSPNGGEKWQLGDTHTILWTPYDPNSGINPVTQVTAYLEKLVNGNFVTVGKIVECGKASIHWEGNLDTCDSNTYAEPGDYYVRVVNNITGASDRSDRPFTLVPRGTIKADLKINGSDGPITVPEGGGTYTISWTSNAEKCSMYFPSSSGDLRKEDLAPSGSMSMKLLPNTSWYAEAIILFCHSQTPIEGSASDSVQILPLNTFITVLSPNGGETIDYRSYYTIKWKAFANLTKVSVALYKNDTFYACIGRDLPTSNALEGYLNWLPSNTVISDSDFGKNIFKIYILGYKAEGGVVEDKSDAPFSIVAP